MVYRKQSCTSYASQKGQKASFPDQTPSVVRYITCYRLQYLYQAPRRQGQALRSLSNMAALASRQVWRHGVGGTLMPRPQNLQVTHVSSSSFSYLTYSFQGSSLHACSASAQPSCDFKRSERAFPSSRQSEALIASSEVGVVDTFVPWWRNFRPSRGQITRSAADGASSAETNQGMLLIFSIVRW